MHRKIQPHTESLHGILPVNKPSSKTAFSLVAVLRRLLGVRCIGHAGTLDPFATGVMLMLIGREYTRLSDRFLSADKEYRATVRLGIATDTYDCDGKEMSRSDLVPTAESLSECIKHFQGEVVQIPPMFSAKKQNGKKLYELARKGKIVERPGVKVQMTTQILSYTYPQIEIVVNCSKGTYIRSVAHDLGVMLGCGAHLIQLQRTRSGDFHLDDCIDGSLLFGTNVDLNLLRNKMISNEAAA